MDYKSVDCFILKFMRIYPFVSPYVCLSNIWAFELNIKEESYEIEVLYEQVLKNKEMFLNFYNIKKHYLVGSIDDYLKRGIKIFLPCDTFRIPYSSLYEKVHMSHYILVEDKKGDTYQIYDDFPYYEGEIDKPSLLKSNNLFRFNKFIFEYFDDSQAKKNISLKESLKYMCDNIDEKSIKTRFFLKNLNEMDISNVIKMRILSDVKLRSMISRYNAIYIILNNIKLDLNNYIDNNKIDIYIEDFKKYIIHWLITINLCEKGKKLQKEIFWGKIELKISELIEYEKKICKNLEDLKNIIENYIGEYK